MGNGLFSFLVIPMRYSLKGWKNGDEFIPVNGMASLGKIHGNQTLTAPWKYNSLDNIFNEDGMRFA